MHEQPLTDASVDRILRLQLLVAWAGEGRCDPPRLGWWRTDLIDPLGGGDFLERLLPRTHGWASLEATREAARRVDEAARKDSADPEALMSLFHLGLHVDQALGHRLAHHKRRSTDRADVLGPRVDVAGDFDRAALERVLLDVPEPAPTRLTPAGRELRGAPPEDAGQAAALLAAALVPFSDTYPLPHFRVRR